MVSMSNVVLDTLQNITVLLVTFAVTDICDCSTFDNPSPAVSKR